MDELKVHYDYIDHEPCTKEDCIYATAKWYRSSQGNCDYLERTGHSRIAGLKGEERLPCNCPYYIPNGKGQRKSKSPMSNKEGINQHRRIDWKPVVALYESRESISDKELGAAFGINPIDVGTYRRRHRMPNKGPGSGNRR